MTDTQPPTPDLDTIQTRADAATPGPWWRDGSEIHQGSRDDNAWAADWVAETCNVNAPDHGEANAAFIAHARTDVPALIAYARHLEARVAELEAEVAQLRASSWPPHFGTPHASIGDATGYAMERNARLAADAARDGR